MDELENIKTTAKNMREAVALLINNISQLDNQQLAALAITVETEHINREAELAGQEY